MKAQPTNDITPLAVRGVVILHLVWGAMILAGKPILGVTAIWLMYKLIPSATVLGWLLIGSGLFAYVGLLFSRTKFSVAAIAVQAILVALSAASAVRSVLLGKYADNTVIDANHIFADQLVFCILLWLYIDALWSMRPKPVTRFDL